MLKTLKMNKTEFLNDFILSNINVEKYQCSEIYNINFANDSWFFKLKDTVFNILFPILSVFWLSLSSSAIT